MRTPKEIKNKGLPTNRSVLILCSLLVLLFLVPSVEAKDDDDDDEDNGERDNEKGEDLEDLGKNMGWSIVISLVAGLVFAVARQKLARRFFTTRLGIDRKRFGLLLKRLQKVHMVAMILAVVLGGTHGAIMLANEGLEDESASGLFTLTAMVLLALAGVAMKFKPLNRRFSKQARLKIRKFHIHRIPLVLVLLGLGLHILG